MSNSVIGKSIIDTRGTKEYHGILQRDVPVMRSVGWIVTCHKKTIVHVKIDLDEDHTAVVHAPARVFRCSDP